MTNAEKYLKDGVDLADLLEKLDEDLKWFIYKEALKGVNADFIKFFNAEECKPQLTEDERVILRNIDKKYDLIKRDNNKNLYVQTAKVSDEDDWNFIAPFNHLFQFIKERRRVFY